MTNEEFMKEVEISYRRSIRVLEEKKKEYGTEEDRLIQFYDVARASDNNPCNALTGMAAKHYSSINMMSRFPHEYILKQWNSKITDLRNYTFLLDALVRDMGIK